MPSKSSVVTVNGDSEYCVMKEMLNSLPPMEYNELEDIVKHVTNFATACPNIPSSSNDDDNKNRNDIEKTWKECVTDPFWNDYQIRTCRRAIEETTATNRTQRTSSTTTTKPFDDTEHKAIMQKLIQEYQTSQYSDKQNVTAKFHMSTEEVNVKDTPTVDATTTVDATMQHLPPVVTGDDDAKMRVEPSTVSSSTSTPETKTDGTKYTAIVVRTYVEHIDTANYSTGSWEGYWEVDVLDDKTATISGLIRIHTHYYENNVNSQIRCQKEYINEEISLQEEMVNSLVAKFEQSSLSYAEKLATKIVQFIIRAELEYYGTIVAVDDVSTLNSTTTATTTTILDDQLRSIRRILPITKTKFQWSNNASTSTQQKNVQMQFMHNMQRKMKK